MRTRWYHAAVLLVAAPAIVVCQQRALESPLPVDVALHVRTFAYDVPIALSPDGRWVAYTLLRDSGAQEALRDYVASATGVPMPRRGADVWVTNTVTGETRDITRGQGSSYAGAWSPDGQRLAFYSDRDGMVRLWIWNRPDGSLRSVPEAIAWGVPWPAAWTPDGKSLITAVLPKGIRPTDIYRSGRETAVSRTTDRTTGSSVVVYRSLPRSPDSTARHTETDDSVDAFAPLMDLVAIDVASGKIERLATNRRLNAWWLSPDGRQVAFGSWKGMRRLQMVQDVELIRLADRHTTTIASAAEFLRALSWSPDGKQLVYATSGYQASGDLMLVSLDGGPPRNLTPGSHPFFGSDDRAPLWDPRGTALYAATGNSVWRIPVPGGSPARLTTVPGVRITGIVAVGNTGRVWSPGSHSMIAATIDSVTMDAGFYAIDLDSGAATRLVRRAVALDDAWGPPRVDAASDGRTMVFASQDAAHPPDLWVAHGPELSDARQLTRLNPEIERYAQGSSRLVQWRSATGAPLRGALLLPPGYDSTRRYPTVIQQYPGDLGSSNVHRYGAAWLLTGPTNLQILVSRGYAVLTPDVPVGSGVEVPMYRDGRAVAVRTAVTPAQDVADAILPAVNRLVELGVADPDRVGVMGCSYGGWGTVALLTQSRRVFKAAIARSGGYYNSPHEYGSLTPGGESIYATTSETLYGGPLWDRRDVYIENSPVFFLDRIETPLLLTAGGRDIFTPPELSAEVFVDLRQLGKEAEFAEYDAGGHCESSMNLADQADYVQRMIRWFDSHLKAGAEPRAKR